MTLPPRDCEVCTETFIPADPRNKTCSGACRMELSRRTWAARGSPVDERRASFHDILPLLGLTDREARYWLKKYVPPRDERCWGRPQLTFVDVYWLAYIAQARSTGLGTLSAARGIPRVQKLLETWKSPLSETRLLESRVSGLLLLTRGAHAIEVPAPVILVDGPALAFSLLLRYKRRVHPHYGGKRNVRDFYSGSTSDDSCSSGSDQPLRCSGLQERSPA